MIHYLLFPFKWFWWFISPTLRAASAERWQRATSAHYDSRPKFRKVVCLPLLIILALGTSHAGCGVERQKVKTLQDVDAARLPATLNNMTIEDVTQFVAPDRKTLTTYNAKRLPKEMMRYSITGRLVGMKLEADGDYHVVIASLNNPKLTMIVELPDPSCMGTPGAFLGPKSFLLRSGLAALMPGGKVTPKFRAPLPNVSSKGAAIIITVNGPGFFDIKHGVPQTGVAPNGFEIHPVEHWTVQ